MKPRPGSSPPRVPSKASTIAHHAMDHDLSLKEAALQLGFVSEEEFDRVVDPAKMVRPYVAAGPSRAGAPVARG